ncbi:Protein jagged-1b, partial [Ophiophagus hannah]
MDFQGQGQWQLQGNGGAGSGQLIERLTRSGMVNPGEGWQHLGHHGRSALLECRLRVRCHEHYYGPSCNLLCRPRDDFFGHHSCDAAGNKVCLDGWTGNKCQRGMSGAGGLARGRAG